jgi:glycosyltransferase involved in cell wall biosynthesis
MPNVRLFLDFVTGHAVQYYLNAADILVLPYTDMINSGSYVLGLSFGCCMVVPLEGAVAELATHGVDAITYDPRDPDGLKQAVEQALAMSEAERAAIGAQAFVLAQRLHWRHTAQAICGALDEG